jgi:hypothetical protein
MSIIKRKWSEAQKLQIIQETERMVYKKPYASTIYRNRYFTNGDGHTMEKVCQV